MSKEIQIEKFLELSNTTPIIDVRSPAEYEQAHIPGALNLPLFSNEERELVGTIYKQKGKVKAVTAGLEIVGPKLVTFTKFALSLKSESILIHCWRGGMRSASMAWLLETVELKCNILTGGYKSYRTYIREQLEKPYNIVLLGGFTGSGKTDLLKILDANGRQIIDLEGIAHHKGSAFGAIGQTAQPSTEMFENILYEQLSKLDPTQPIWVEDESHNIGRDFIPEPFWLQMRKSPLVVVDATFKQRVERLIRDYGGFPAEKLKASIQKIEKRLGYDKCKLALEACENNNLDTAAEICLLYYDKAYKNQLVNRFGDKLGTLPQITFDPSNSQEIIEQLDSIATILNKRLK
ncbi:MAG: tRNA 2-selenouridine(34) synthase MnmH [Bacteroidales bacterium]|nr:tRNA 2-selenouridine(34) synthase MnmH [Bacteroidales bacterium]